MTSGVRITFEQVMESIESEGCELLTQCDSIRFKDHIELRCPCGNSFTTTYEHFVYDRKTICDECSYRRRGDKLRVNFNEVLGRIEYAGYVYLSGEYSKRNDRTLTLTDENGYHYLCSLAEIDGAIRNNGRLEYVSKANPHTIPNIRRYLILNDKTFELVSETYTRAIDRNLDFQCMVSGCGEQWTTSWAAITTGQGCPFCVGKKVGRSNSFGDLYPELLNEWDYDKNKVSPFEITVHTHEDIWWKCSGCKHSWKTRPTKRVFDNTGCPVCASSKGEYRVTEILNYYGMRFERQAWFEDCPRITQKPLQFDFYLPDYHACIEYNGIQHYEPIDFAGRGMKWARKLFRENQKRDKIKSDYCRDHNIPLIVIPYTSFNEIESILTQQLHI